MLNDSSVLEEMLREEHVMDVLGALEYDPDVKQPQKHRDFLQSHVQFKVRYSAVAHIAALEI